MTAGTDEPLLLAVVDDEPMITDAVKRHLEEAGQRPIVVFGFDRPRRLEHFADLEQLTHAVVDLSFGRDDIDGPEVRPEAEIGADAIRLLRQRCPRCSIVIATRNDTPLVTEMAVAIRQTWPEIVFFHKADGRLRARIEDFVVGRHYQDNAEIALDLIGVEPVDPRRIRRAVEATGRTNPQTRLLLSLADLPQQPTRHELAERLGKGERYVRNLVNDLTGVLIDWELLEREQGGGINRLWPWARARRPMLNATLAGC